MSTPTDTTPEAPAKKASLRDRYRDQVIRERAIARLAARNAEERAKLDAELKTRYAEEGTSTVRLDYDGIKLAQATVGIKQPTAEVTDEAALTAWVAEHIGPDSVEYIARPRASVVKALSKDPQPAEDGSILWTDSEGEVHTVPGMRYVPGGAVRGVSVTSVDKEALDDLLDSGKVALGSILPALDA